MMNIPFDTLPMQLPVFPLEGVLLLPRGQLPLNIFEPRYLAMVNDALCCDRMIGMVQPNGSQSTKNGTDIFKTGCAGRITQFQETDDGRYLITLTGVCRFTVAEEISLLQGYRRVRPDWSEFRKDLEKPPSLDLDRTHLTNLLKHYFTINELSMDWELIDAIADESLLTALAMICPLSPPEKQALLESPCCRSRASLFISLLEIAVHQGGQGCSEH
jgi:Lon protease-like protein